jgi:hypothetical protein
MIAHSKAGNCLPSFSSNQHIILIKINTSKTSKTLKTLKTSKTLKTLKTSKTLKTLKSRIAYICGFLFYSPLLSKLNKIEILL